MTTAESESKLHLKFLAEARIFSGLDEDQLADVLDRLNLNSFKKGGMIISLGDASENMYIYIIIRGRCKVSLPFKFGMGENILAFLKKGDCFGEMGVITGEKRSANIVCATDVELFMLKASDFWELANKYTVIYKNVIHIQSKRIVALNEGRKSRKRPSLNLERDQKKTLKDFIALTENHVGKLMDRRTNAPQPKRELHTAPKKGLLFRNKIVRSLLSMMTAPYLSNISGMENIPKDKPVIFLLSYRTYFDFIFFLKIFDQLGPDRLPTIAVQFDPGLRKMITFFKPFLSALFFSYIKRGDEELLKSANDTINLVKGLELTEKKVDIVLHPFLSRSMTYDSKLEYEHFEICLKGGEERDIIPVSITGTDKFWPFEPWERKFFKLSAFANLKSVEIKIGEKISLPDMGFQDKFEQCGWVEDKIKTLFDKTNDLIGEKMAALENKQYLPMDKGIQSRLLVDFNKKWNHRLSLMLASGLSLRESMGKPSIKVRHFLWHAEMLHVFLDHLEEEKFILPIWAKGMLISGASHADMDWPYLSMDHSYNPFNKKGMKLIVRFPDLMTTIRKEVGRLFGLIEKGTTIDKVLFKMGKIYHFMTDLAVPAHVHNIPHMFLDVPKIGKCDFEEFLGLDEQLLKLSEQEIGDISWSKVNSFDEFYEGLDHIARNTFLNSAFDYESLQSIASERMITDYRDKDDLFMKLKRMGVSVMPAEGYSEDELYYVRNLTTQQCKRISEETTFYALKMMSSCFLFLIEEVNNKMLFRDELFDYQA